VHRLGLRILHVVEPASPVIDPFAGGIFDLRSRAVSECGQRVLDEAAQRSRRVAPELGISTQLEAGRVAETVCAAGRRAALVVVGRRTRRYGAHAADWRIARRAEGPGSIIELGDECRRGPSAGRVVVSLDDAAGSPQAIEFAFRSASRRGIGLTTVHTAAVPGAAAIEQAVCECQAAYPDVPILRRLASSSAGPALVEESKGAALLVIAADRQGRLHDALFSSVAHIVFRWGASPIAIVRPSRTPLPR
jgi:nucleotide-binding universal stress UspA family protein